MKAVKKCCVPNFAKFMLINMGMAHHTSFLQITPQIWRLPFVSFTDDHALWFNLYLWSISSPPSEESRLVWLCFQCSKLINVDLDIQWGSQQGVTSVRTKERIYSRTGKQENQKGKTWQSHLHITDETLKKITESETNIQDWLFLFLEHFQGSIKNQGSDFQLSKH